jgi:hypothetical protein
MCPLSNKLFEESEKLQKLGGTTEDILGLYRRSGLSILESMQFLTKLTNVSLAEAKRIVHFSETWSDIRADHDRFDSAVEDAVGSVKRED